MDLDLSNGNGSGDDGQNFEAADFLFFYSIDIQEQAISALRGWDTKIYFLIFVAFLFCVGYVLKDMTILGASIELGFWGKFSLLVGKLTLVFCVLVLSLPSASTDAEEFSVSTEEFSHTAVLPMSVLNEMKTHSLSECKIALSREIDKEIQHIGKETELRKKRFDTGLFFLVLSFTCLLFA